MNIESTFRIDRKLFKITVGENSAGKFLKIRETNAKGGNLIVIPFEGVTMFQNQLKAVVAKEQEYHSLDDILGTSLTEFINLQVGASN